MSQWSRGSGYSNDELMRMQRDAERRVREMQRQADRNLHNTASAGNFSSGTEGPSAGGRQSSQTSSPSMSSNGPSHSQGHPQNGMNQSGQGGFPQNFQQGSQSGSVSPRPGGGPPHPGGGNPLENLLHSLSGGALGNAGGNGSLFSLFGGKKGEHASPLGKIMDALNLDQERLILILLAVLIWNEGGDKTLLLALIYLIL